jgi:hypothetical protein
MAKQRARGLDNVTIDYMWELLKGSSKSNIKNYAQKANVSLDTTMREFIAIINDNYEPYITGEYADRFGCAFSHMAEFQDTFSDDERAVLYDMHKRLMTERRAAKKASLEAITTGFDSDVGPGSSATDQDAPRCTTPASADLDAQLSIITPMKLPPPPAGASIAAAADEPAADGGSERIVKLERQVADLKGSKAMKTMQEDIKSMKEELEAMEAMREEMRAMRQELDATKAEMKAMKKGIRGVLGDVNQLLMGAMERMAL